MNNNLLHIRYILRITACILLAFIIRSCANKGIGPQGGPKDETPPVMVKETPLNGSVNYTGKSIEILFNEYLQLNDVANQVLISPPQQRPPEVKALGKKVMVNFEEDLKDSTTYTIEFGSAICDLNEKNPIEGYSFSFATGPEIDTLQISGIMINAENLNPIAGINVGIHRNLTDSALLNEPFTRIARTNSEGRFTIQNIHQGTYRLYGLDDVSRDYLYQPGEGLAICDSLLSPFINKVGVVDTVFFADSIVASFDSLQLASLPHDSLGRYVDTIISKTVDEYGPADIVLFFFTEDKQRHYFVRPNREQQHFFQLIFSAPQDSLPVISPITKVQPLIPMPVTDTLTADADSAATAPVILVPDSTRQPVDWTDYALIQPSLHLDTVTVWLTDSAAIRVDTIEFAMTYMMSDSLYNLVPKTDTIRALYRAPRISEKAKAGMSKTGPKPSLAIKHNAKTGFDIYDSIRISSPTPIREFRPEMIHLSLKVDSLLRPLPTEVMMLDSAKMKFVIPYEWQPETEYQLTIDSAAFTDVYGVQNQLINAPLKVRSLEDYSTLIVLMDSIDYRARIQILTEKDVVLRELPVSDEGAKFEYLKPDSYYMRLYLDLNGDGKWTTGDWLQHRQPEPVYYYSGKLTLRANWDFEETFNIYEKPLLEQKPKELIEAGSKNNKKK